MIDGFNNPFSSFDKSAESQLKEIISKGKMELEIELKSNLQKGDAEIALLKIINYKMLKKILSNKKKKL